MELVSGISTQNVEIAQGDIVRIRMEEDKYFKLKKTVRHITKEYVVAVVLTVMMMALGIISGELEMTKNDVTSNTYFNLVSIYLIFAWGMDWVHMLIRKTYLTNSWKFNIACIVAINIINLLVVFFFRNAIMELSIKGLCYYVIGACVVEAVIKVLIHIAEKRNQIRYRKELCIEKVVREN